MQLSEVEESIASAKEALEKIDAGFKIEGAASNSNSFISSFEGIIDLSYSTINVVEGVYYTRLAIVCMLMETFGYVPDKKPTSFIRDIQHLNNANFCSHFVTVDKRFRDRAIAASEFVNHPLKILSLEQAEREFG